MTDVQVRQDLVDSAVKFLNDPQVQQSPLSKRLAFLDSKGLTQQEIQQALSQTNTTTSQQVVAPPVPPPIQHYVQQPQGWDWRDYTLGMLGISGLAFGAFKLAQRFSSDQSLLVKQLEERLLHTVTLVQDQQQQFDKVLKKQQEHDKLAQSDLETLQDQLKEVQNELKSLKSLVLNRKIQTVKPEEQAPKPFVPSWQLEQDNSISNTT